MRGSRAIGGSNLERANSKKKERGRFRTAARWSWNWDDGAPTCPVRECSVGPEDT